MSWNRSSWRWQNNVTADAAHGRRREGASGADDRRYQCGEILHLVGPNGAGKSTLLARMAGLTTGPGQITLLEHPLADWSPGSLAHRRSYLVQQQVPPFAMPVWHYLMLHLHDKQNTALLTEVAAALGLEDKLPRHASQLSGGEWQRVRLAAVILQIHPQATLTGGCCSGRTHEWSGCRPAGGAGFAVKRVEPERYCRGDEQPRP